jgi:predicted nucleic acid-binding protein
MLALRLLIDTNVLISAALKPDGLQRTTFLLAITKPSRLYVSTPILEEYADVLSRPELSIRRGLRLQLLQLIKNHDHPLFLIAFLPWGAILLLFSQARAPANRV